MWAERRALAGAGLLAMAAALAGGCTAAAPAREHRPPPQMTDFSRQPQRMAAGAANLVEYEPAEDLELRFQYAMSLIGQLHYADALQELGRIEAIIDRYGWPPAPDSPVDGSPRRAPAGGDAGTARDRRPELLFWSGYCHEKLESHSLARAYYYRVIDAFPQTPSARQAVRRLAALDAT